MPPTKKNTKRIPYFRDYKFTIYKFSDFEPASAFASGHHSPERFEQAIHKPTGEKFVLKRAHYIQRPYKDFILCLNEIMGGLIYTRVFKQYVPFIVFIYNDINDAKWPQWFIGSKLEAKLYPLTHKNHYDWTNAILVDCIMANWDVIKNRNSFLVDKNSNNTTPSKTRVIRIDVGGTMAFRAMGEDKIPFISKEVPHEHISMRQYNPLFRKIITPDVLSKSIRYLQTLYAKDKFRQLDEIRNTIITTLKKYQKEYGIQSDMLKVGLDLVENNTAAIKMRWKWYLDNKDLVINDKKGIK